jgi:hypothetical protein
MLERFLWGYFCLTGAASLLIYGACLAAAHADRVNHHWQNRRTPQPEEMTASYAPKSLVQPRSVPRQWATERNR